MIGALQQERADRKLILLAKSNKKGRCHEDWLQSIFWGGVVSKYPLKSDKYARFECKIRRANITTGLRPVPKTEAGKDTDDTYSFEE